MNSSDLLSAAFLLQFCHNFMQNAECLYNQLIGVAHEEECPILSPNEGIIFLRVEVIRFVKGDNSLQDLLVKFVCSYFDVPRIRISDEEVSALGIDVVCV